VEGEEGESEVEARINPTFGFAGEPQPRVEALPGSIAFMGRNESVVLTCPMAMKRVNGYWAGRMPVSARRRIWFTLEYRSLGEAERQGGPAFNSESALRGTLAYWREWISGCTYQGPYRSQVIRSALTLKMLTYGPTGAMVAAPTTSLPESRGGGRNWDYRYCWLRDSALILNVFHAIGYGREAVRFFDWLKRIGIRRRNPLAPFYTVRGSDAPDETLLPRLEGYRGLGPVRIGNAARDQLQLDAYGELVDAVHMCYASMEPPHPRMGREVADLADRAAAHWREPDHGIWEFPAGTRHFLHSKLSCWMALDRALRLADLGAIDSVAPNWMREREAIRHLILTQGFDSRQGAFTQSIGSRELDAAVLAFPLVGFLQAGDPRVRSTVIRIQEDLMRNGYLLRYSAKDGIPAKEGAFLLVNFWLVGALCLSGEWEAATTFFERLLGTCNDLGLLAEEADPESGAPLGNFPQGISHLGLIRAALHLRDGPRPQPGQGD
jgi:GH15 family glucan-1,4-alpha-glucosidase